MKGMTLVEMLITLVIFGVISIIVVMVLAFLNREETITQATLLEDHYFLVEALDLKKILSAFLNEFGTLNVDSTTTVFGTIFYPDTPFVALPATVTFNEAEDKLILEKITPVTSKKFEFDVKRVEKVIFEPYGKGVLVSCVSNGRILKFFVGGEE